MSGTFVISGIITATIESGTWGGGSSVWNTDNTSLINSINNAISSFPGPLGCGKLTVDDPDPTIGSHNITLVFGSVVWSLDGNPAVDINGLPAGFTPTSASLKISCDVTGNPATLLLNVLGIDHSYDLNSIISPITYNFDFSGTPPTLVELQSQIELKITFTAVNASEFFWDLRIEGAYDIETFVEPNPNNTTNPDVFQPGVDNVTVSSPGPPSGPDLTTITQIDIKKPEPDNTLIVSIPQTCFTTQNITILVFLLPLLRLIFNVNGCLPGPPYFPDLPCMGPLPKCPPPDWKPGKYNIFGVTFSGSVILGSLYISLKNGSGIYSIVSGKTNDTIYINSPGNNQTMDFKIPNPFFKTGLIGG